MVKCSLASFLNAHFQVDRVSHHIHLNRVQAVEHVTIVVIKVTNGIVIAGKTLVHERLVVNIATLHLQDTIQEVRVIDRVTHPRHIAQVIFFTLINVEVNIHMLIVDGFNAVGSNQSIAITPRVELFGQQVFILSIFFGQELFRAEHIHKTLFVRLFHGTF